jgi:hypothetical protein
MPRYRQIPALLLLAILLASCNWPLSHPEAEPLVAAKASSPEGAPSLKEDRGRQTRDSSAVTGSATAFVSPLATPGQATLPPTSAPVPGHSGLFSGRSLRFDLPEGYRVLEGLDGGCFLYHESLPGFLILYPQLGEPRAMLAELLNATTGLRRTESPLEVDISGLTFVGLFVETDAGSRLFLAAADGWVLVAQGPAEDWPTLAGGFNQVLTSLSFKEGF